ncbi:formyltetrahydrofolate deformylase [Conexibacter sp. SYSU D00693]|uniref:formyltetrahydrofolate deformylase n=1 Tax=Conexibacter sp. SYSU D00693 TaxID=2812560 RepID=UPI00196B5DE7|nr:formyltetrahydrofolate deformylase [Conexibacter sp. SYSU D00693]
MQPQEAPGAEHAIVRLVGTCPDRPGIVAAVSRFLAEAGANVVELDQHSTDPRGGQYFMRLAFDVERRRLPTLEQDFEHAVARHFDLDWWIWPVERRKRMAILCSRPDHCVLDLLWRHANGELDADVALVLSNHEDLRDRVQAFGVPYVHVPVFRESKAEAEQAMLDQLRDEVDLVVLARYMQVLSGDFLERLQAPVINIHHSFLPAFAGADPYRRAHDRGVKIIGATAHYVTEELDAGPIIEQDVVRVSHRDDVAALQRIGKDVERVVLARAVARHLDDRVLVHDGRTIVF